MNFTLKPVFVGWSTLLTQLPLQIFLTLWCAIFFGGIAAALSGGLDGDFEAATFFASPPIMFFALVGLIGTPLIAYFGKKANYSRAAFRFFEDRLELEEGFFSINRKTVRYADIREITLHQGFFQRFNGLGTIYLATQATGADRDAGGFAALGFGAVSASGVMVRDVANPEVQYDRLRTAIKPGV